MSLPVLIVWIELMLLIRAKANALSLQVINNIIDLGKDKNSNNYQLLYKSSLTSTQILQATPPQKIVYINLDNSCKYVAIYLNNKMLQIYKIESA